MAQTRHPQLSHIGIFAHDVDRLERFYTRVFGLVVTDRGVGKTFRNRLSFLSASAEQHHQLVLSSGRPDQSPSTIMQLSFMVWSVDDLRRLRLIALENGASNLIGLNHGNSWSIYFDDPEGNKVEVYMDTPFHTPQPYGEPLNLDQSNAALLAETKALVDSRAGSKQRADYVAELAARLRTDES